MDFYNIQYSFIVKRMANYYYIIIAIKNVSEFFLGVQYFYMHVSQKYLFN